MNVWGVACASACVLLCVCVFIDHDYYSVRAFVTKLYPCWGATFKQGYFIGGWKTDTFIPCASLQIHFISYWLSCKVQNSPKVSKFLRIKKNMRFSYLNVICSVYGCGSYHFYKTVSGKVKNRIAMRFSGCFYLPYHFCFYIPTLFFKRTFKLHKCTLFYNNNNYI